MYTEHKHFKLPNNNSEVDVFISPTGDIEVMIEGNQQVLKGDFHHLSFKKMNAGVDLIYKTHSKKSSWDIILTPQDAEIVTKMMNEADEYYEIIMRDL